MKTKTWHNFFLSLSITLLICGSIFLTYGARGEALTAPNKPQAALGTGFTYQGYLSDGTGALDGTCNLTFALYDEAGTGAPPTGGTEIGTQTGDVTVSDGYFTTLLDFGVTAFDGEARWLQITVNSCNSSGTATTLSPRVALTGAPYAHSLRPGASISGDGTVLNLSTTATSGNALNVIASASTGNAAAIYGSSIASGGAGLSGYNSGNGYGVYGGSGTGHGVHGKASPPDGYGIYSEGNAYVEGELFWDAKVSYLSISTAAFIPEQMNDSGHVAYDNEGHYLKNESSSSEWFVAPVQLPHGAKITELRAGWYDGSDTQASVFLRRRSMTDTTQTFESMAQVASVGSFTGPQEGVRNDDTIDNDVIDNEKYAYYLEVGMQAVAEDIRLKGVVIVYEITEPY